MASSHLFDRFWRWWLKETAEDSLDWSDESMPELRREISRNAEIQVGIRMGASTWLVA